MYINQRSYDVEGELRQIWYDKNRDLALHCISIAPVLKNNDPVVIEGEKIARSFQSAVLFLYITKHLFDLAINIMGYGAEGQPTEKYDQAIATRKRLYQNIVDAFDSLVGNKVFDNVITDLLIRIDNESYATRREGRDMPSVSQIIGRTFKWSPDDVKIGEHQVLAFTKITDTLERFSLSMSGLFDAIEKMNVEFIVRLFNLGALTKEQARSRFDHRNSVRLSINHIILLGEVGIFTPEEVMDKLGEHFEQPETGGPSYTFPGPFGEWN